MFIHVIYYNKCLTFSCIEQNEYTERTTQRTLETGESSTPADDLDIWLDVTGGKKKGRTLGAGNVGDPRYVLLGESSSSQTFAAGPSVQEVSIFFK